MTKSIKSRKMNYQKYFYFFGYLANAGIETDIHKSWASLVVAAATFKCDAHKTCRT